MLSLYPVQLHAASARSNACAIVFNFCHSSPIEMASDTNYVEADIEILVIDHNGALLIYKVRGIMSAA